MTRLISKAEGWEKAYEAFQHINFSAFDYNAVKQSMLDYLKLYFPESFNDMIESSELISILELFAYLAEIVSYRLDANAHENFLTVAQRKQSVLRLAKLISYTASRNIPARGLVKITSISTTENVYDSNGNNLAGITINWNDTDNSNWKEQFILIINQIFSQEFGTVAPNDRVQVDDVLFELYALNNNPLSNGVITYGSTAGTDSVSMEIVPVSLDGFGPYEKRPDNTGAFTLLYGSDGLGDGSDTTGFFMFTKQGTLAKYTTTFDGVTPNLTYDLDIENINEIDVWVNNVSPETLEILDDGTGGNNRSGEWEQVNTVNGQNIAFNVTQGTQKYELETLEDDKIRLIFGDGKLSAIPNGTFDIWYRTSHNTDLVIQKSSVVNQSGSFTYMDSNQKPQSINVEFSLINSLQNASSSETLEHIRRVAPSTYYTQDRMVNAQDHNTFMLQDPSILKLRAINRTFAGDSKYIAWHDPSEAYENVKIFGDDGIVYFRDVEDTVEVNEAITGLTLLNNYIEPLIGEVEVYLKIHELANNANVAIQSRKLFTTGTKWVPKERELILETLGEPTDYNLTPPPGNFPVGLTFDPTTGNGLGTWTATHPPLPNTIIEIDQIMQGSTIAGWIITTRGRRMLAHSASTKFWFNNQSGVVVDYNTMYPNPDIFNILKANPDGKIRDCNIQEQDIDFRIIGTELIDAGLPNAGLPNINELKLMSADTNGDNIPDDPAAEHFLDPIYYGAPFFNTIGFINGQTIATSTVDGTMVVSTPTPGYAIVVGGGDIFKVEETGAVSLLYTANDDIGTIAATEDLQTIVALVATEWPSDTPRMVRSGDGGDTWNVVNDTNFNNWLDSFFMGLYVAGMEYSDGLFYFIASGNDIDAGVGTPMWTSPDGLNWTKRDLTGLPIPGTDPDLVATGLWRTADGTFYVFNEVEYVNWEPGRDITSWYSQDGFNFNMLDDTAVLDGDPQTNFYGRALTVGGVNTIMYNRSDWYYTHTPPGDLVRTGNAMVVTDVPLVAPFEWGGNLYAINDEAEELNVSTDWGASWNFVSTNIPMILFSATTNHQKNTFTTNENALICGWNALYCSSDMGTWVASDPMPMLNHVLATPTFKMNGT